MRNSACMVVLFAAWTGVVRGADWPQFRGPSRDGISPERGLLQKWPDGGPRVVWRNDKIGYGWSSVAVVKATVYTSGVIDDILTVTSLDSAGHVRWQQRLERASKGAGYKGSRSTPTVDGNRLYVVSGDGTVYCLTADSGEQVWSANLVQRYGNGVPRWSMAESVLIDGNRAICAPGARGSMVALDKHTGKEIWAAEPVDSKTGYASVMLIEYRGVRQLVTFSGKSVFGANADTGNLLWKDKRAHQRYGDVNATSVVFADGMLYVTSGYRAGSVGYRVNVAGKRVSVTRAWESRFLDDHHGGVVLIDGKVIGVGHERRGLTALDLKTGREICRVRKFREASVICADGKLICQGHRGTIALVNPATGKVISSFRLKTQKRTWAIPAVSDGLLYIRNGSQVTCYDIRKTS